MSEELRSLFDSIYERFLLRDFMGKVIPGLILLTALTHLVWPNQRLLGRMPRWGVLEAAVIFGVAWIAGLVVQSLGETRPCRLIRYFPPEYGVGLDKVVMKAFYVDFRQCVNSTFEEGANGNTLRGRETRQHLERLTVIKEACGNSAVALLLAAGMTGIGMALQLCGSGSPYSSFCQSKTGCVVGIVTMIVAATLLLRMHRKHAERQLWYMEVVLGKALNSGQ